MRERFRYDRVEWSVYPVTAPTEAPLTLPEIRERLRLTSVASEDADLTIMMNAAVRWWEDTTGQYLMSQTVEMRLDRFPRYDKVMFVPISPNPTLGSVKYDDTEGVEQTWGTDDYLYVSEYAGGRLRAILNWPSVRKDRFHQVRLRATAGYTAAQVPDDVKDALLLMVGARYAYRENLHFGQRQSLAAIPMGAESIAERYRVFWDKVKVV